jgi:hypothetical protein
MHIRAYTLSTISDIYVAAFVRSQTSVSSARYVCHRSRDCREAFGADDREAVCQPGHRPGVLKIREQGPGHRSVHHSPYPCIVSIGRLLVDALLTALLAPSFAQILRTRHGPFQRVI